MGNRQKFYRFNILCPIPRWKKCQVIRVYGLTVDNQTRCEHYHSPLDIIAIKFKCCGKFYPCYQCHQACENHSIERWKPNEFHEQAILCGACQTIISIQQYMSVTACPHCTSQFNSGCRKHYHLYFEID